MNPCIHNIRAELAQTVSIFMLERRLNSVQDLEKIQDSDAYSEYKVSEKV